MLILSHLLDSSHPWYYAIASFWRVWLDYTACDCSVECLSVEYVKENVTAEATYNLAGQSTRQSKLLEAMKFRVNV